MSSKLNRGISLPIEAMSWRQTGEAPAQAFRPGPPLAERKNVDADALEARIRQLETEVERRAQEAQTRGRQEGESAARQQAEAQMSAVMNRLARSIDEITGMRERLRHEAEEEVVGLALAVARRVLHREMTIAPEALLGLLKAALHQVDARELHRVRIHPGSAGLLQQHLESIGLPRRVEVVPDAGLERGGLVLETGRGTLDASVETQLDEIERGFADLVRRGP